MKLLKTIIKTAYFHHQTLPHININSWDEMENLLKLMINHQEKTLFLAITEQIINLLGGYQIVSDIFHRWTSYYEINNVYLHLDHSLEWKNCQKAIIAGFDSVMFDGSQLTIEENTHQAKKIFALTEKTNTVLELEVGNVDSNYSKISEIKKMIESVQPNLLAIAIGNHHGYEKKKKKIDLIHLAKIRAITKIPLVLHGGSGIDFQQLSQAKKLGITKINYDSLLQKTFAETILAAEKKLKTEKKKWFWWPTISRYGRATVNEKIEKILKFCYQNNEK